MITVKQSGFQTSIQDIGRHGYRHFGVPGGGALDIRALNKANLLVGNSENQAAIEIGIGSLEMQFNIDCAVAIIGENANVLLTDENNHFIHAPNNQAIDITPSKRLKIISTNSGSHTYLAVSGGFKSDIAFQSASTDSTTKLGGHFGRVLKKGDVLTVNKILRQDDLKKITQKKLLVRPEIPSQTIRALPGPESSWFTKTAQDFFWQSDWEISANSNRMGARLSGPYITRNGIDNEIGKNTGQHSQKHNTQATSVSTQRQHLLSHGVLPGTVQVPDYGQPIVLLADAQTTGGYPRIASVISADLWQFAHIPFGTSIRFSLCTHKEAVDAIKQQQFEANRFKIVLQGTRDN